MDGQRIAIIGAGTTGLASALFLTAGGNDVTILEQFDAPKPLGAGLMLQPTGLACLATLGLDKTVITQSRIIARIDGRTVSGRNVFDIGYSDLGPNVFGLGVHRATLFEALYDAVQRAGITVQTSTPIVDTGIGTAGRWLEDANGDRHGPFDCVIDASGACARLRANHGDVRYVRPYPYAAVWGVCAEPDDWPWPDILAQRFHSARHMLGVLPLGQREGAAAPQMAFFWSMRADRHEAWRERGIAAWHAEIDRYWPDAAPLARQFFSIDDLTFATYPDVVMKRFHGERIIFLGDAAHSTSPQLGQGANLALADALVFARTLAEAGDFPSAFAAYAKERRAHLRFYQIASRYLTPFFQSDSRIAPFVRDAAFAPMARMPYVRREMVRTLAGVKTGLFSSLDPGDWHEGYGLGG